MKNAVALRSLCNAIANTFYPDKDTLDLALFNEGIDPQADATPKDAAIFRVAISLCMGYIEGSRTENGISTSVMQDTVKESIRYWCNMYGLDADDILSDYLVVKEDGSHLW